MTLNGTARAAKFAVTLPTALDGRQYVADL